MLRAGGSRRGNAYITGGSGAFDTLSLNGKGAITSGTYTPTLTNATNVAASAAVGFQYLRVGNVCTVSGRLTIDPTAATTDTHIGISLPVASVLANASNVAGSGVSLLTASAVNPAGVIIGNVGSAYAEYQFTSDGTAGNINHYVQFTYQIL
jgi:hypothetical protein